MTVPPESAAGLMPNGTQALPADLRVTGVAGADLDARAEAAGEPYPLTPLQAGMLYQALLTPAAGVNVEQVVARLREPVDAERLERAWAAVVRRHGVLRTRFRWTGVPEPVQEVLPAARVEMARHDVSGLAPAERDEALERWLRDDRARGFDLAQAPAMRVALFHAAADEHVLVWTFHHVLLDVRSITAVLHEAFTLYDADGDDAGLPPRAPFRGHVEWLRGRDAAADEAFWTERLRGLATPQPVRALRAAPRDPGAEPHFGRREIRLSERADAALCTLKRERGINRNKVVQGAWALLLGRYTGSAEAVFGLVRGGRDTGVPGSGEMVGLLINTVPVRVPLPADARVADWLLEIAARGAEAGAHEHAALTDVQRWSGLPQGAPLFDTLVNYQPAPFDAPLRGVEGRSFRLLENPGYPLTLAIADEAPLHAWIDYDAGLFDAAAVDRMLGHFARLVEQMVEGPDRLLGTLDPLGDAERNQLVVEWNRTRAEYPAGACIHQLVEAQAERTPDGVALVHGTDSLTYAELNARANRLAHHLRRLGVGPEVRVGVSLERGLDLVVSLLAVLKAGGAYVPLDPSYPAERLAFLRADAGVAVLVTQEALLGELSARPDVPVVSVDGARQEIAAESAENPASGAAPRNLAYLIYTSGSTGVPKGVAIEHGNAAALLGWAWGVFSGEELSGVLASTSVGFDLSVYELFVPLTRGGTVILVENALALPTSPAADRVRLVNTVPSAITALLKSGGIPSSVTTVNLAGEPLKQEVVEALYAHGVERVYDLYGPSEDTTYSTWTLRRAGGTANIGRAIGNSQAYVLDAALRPVPIGIPGELFLGGRGVTRGYLGRPGLTAERYLPDPFAAEPGARMYRTGDQVRWQPDVTLAYMGRLDHQVKVRGFRIETGEIEAVLRRHPEVAECVVVPRADAAGEQRLVAYVVGGVDAEALRAHLRRSLPEHMVPGAFVSLDALPLTPNGKLDRKALPEPGLASSAGRYVAPRTPVEEVLAAVWGDVLGVERVGVEDRFVELGGHSLLATRVVSRVREALGVELGVRALFETPTVATLAAAVEEIRHAGLPVAPPVVPVPRDRPLPLSFAQERLWFLDRMEQGSAFYNIPATLRIAGALDAAALERALGEIVRRHEALRTVFPEAGGAPVQAVVPFAGFTLPVEDLSALEGAEREAAVARRAAEHAARPFDLAAGPVFRAGLLRLDGQEHVLLLSMHHIASDGWSLDVLFRELSALYAAYVGGAESPLPALPVQYADYTVWQREHLRGEALDRQLAYWKERLAGAPGLLELPTDHPRPAVQTFRGARERVDLPPELLERLQALGRAEGATLYMVLLGAFQVLLGTYAASDDVVVGSPSAGRTRGETEALIGFFVNTLVLRTELGGDPGFREVLRRVREATLGAFDHQDLPFERLVAELEPERSLSHSPLVQVMFALENAGGARGALPGLRVEPVQADLPLAKFDLTLTFSAEDGGLRGVLEYASDLFEPGTVRRMLGHLRRVLEQAAGRPEARLSELDLLSPGERGMVVEGWNRTEQPYDADRCIHALVEAQAERTPDAPAVADGAVSLTYAELNARANRLARHLARLGVGPEVRVGVCLERGAELIVSALAVLKAGGGYVALDPAYPAGRLELMLRDSGAAVLLTHGGLTPPPLAAGVRVVRVDADRQAIAAESDANLASGATPRGLAYVVYTSGSTGTPKGVAVDHAALGSLCAWHGRAFGITGGDRATQLASPGFDASIWEVWPYLVRGASLRVAPEAVRADPEALRDWLVQERITVSFVPTPVAEPLLALEWPRTAALRWLLTGGDRLRARPAAGMPFALSNNYGPTECTVVATSGVVEARGDRAPSIGGPIENTRVYVLGAAMRPLPAGVPGELYVGGAQVARGYLNRPALTAERFVPDPFSAEPGARLYRTGDRVRWLADGTVDYLGRLDEQVKVRGFRIELGEIEAVLRRHPEVRDCAVIAHDDAAAGRRLAAYVVGGADAAALRAHLAGTLPDYMVPSAFVALDALPLTPNGKLDRRALPAPELGSADAYVAPRTPTEEVLAGIWAAMLGRERVGARDGFFDLGGHSLLATRVVSRIREVFGVELSVRVLFEAPTVAGLARAVDEIRRDGVPALPPVVSVDRTGALPLSFAQERLWFLDRMEAGSAFYNIPAALRLAGALDVAALERALGEIVRRHEALRTTFPEAGGAPVQAIAPFTGFVLPVEDLSALDDAARDAAVRRRAADEVARPFDLAAGPVFRAALLRLGAQEHVLLLSMHHIASDGWSVGVLFRELSALYAAFRDGAGSPLAEPPVQYADFAVWQREQLRGEALDRQLAYWTGRLAGAPALLELPTDRPRPAVQSHRGAQEAARLPAGLLERLEALGRRDGVTLYMVLLGAFQVLLSRYSGSGDVVVGSPIAGRTRGEVEGLIGFFVNMLPLRTDLSGDPGFREVLRRVREGTLDAYEHQEVPFEKLVEELQPERSLSYSPLFQAVFALNEAEGAHPTLAGVRTEVVQTEWTTTKFDLTLFLTTGQDGLHALLEYSTDLFERDTVLRMMRHLERVLEQVAERPEARLSELTLLDGAERGLVVEEWNRTAAEYPAGRCIHQLFQAQAARTPDAVALVHETDSLTYAELNERANRLAHHLVRLGVGPEARVGVCLERGLDLVVALIAVHKAGGAYVPLDPAYPTERLRLTLADAGVAVLVTQEKLRGLVTVEPGVAVVIREQAQAEIAAESAENPESGATPRNLAYLIYTSGSTGIPKGVAIEHESAVVMIAWAWSVYSEQDFSGMLASTSISFDMSVYELFATLTRGGTVIVVENALALPGSAAAEQVRLLDTVPSAAAALLKTGGIPAGVRTVNLGGEPLKAELVDDLYAHGVERVYDMYGPSEDTTFSTYALREPGGPVTIGRILSNSQAYVLDSALQPLPVGVPGELYLGGKGVTRGYLGRPGLTAGRYVPDPFSAEPGARMYRTGDRIRWKADGTLEYLGRFDHQVKIRGFRVEVGEIEAVLRRDGAVSDCVVMARADEAGETRLVAYVVGQADADELRAHVKRSVPDYMVPSAFVFLDALPLTPNGKLDRKALPEPQFASTTGYVAPRTPTEEVLAGIWADVLHVERVGAEDSFFALGGHSLRATRVVSRVREVLGVELPLRAMFESPTVAALAEAVNELRRAAPPQPPSVAPAAADGASPLSFAQERLWFLDRLESGSALYNLPSALRLTGEMDGAALERALGEIVRRHDALRTTFPEVNGAPVQLVAPFAGFALPVEDLSALDGAQAEAEVHRLANEAAARPFDLSAGPLFRAALVRLGAQDHVLLLTMHHIVSDGWSLGVLYRELSALYGAYREGAVSPLPELPLQYADYARRQREQLRGEVLDRQMAYWKARLAGAPALLELPTDHPRPAVQTYRGGHAPVAYPAELLERLRTLGQREGATLYMVLLAAFQLLLAKYSGSRDIVVGSPIAGRTRGEVEPLIGFFTNMLALRTDLSGDPDFHEVLRRVRSGTLGAYEHQDVPFEKLVAEVEPDHSLSRSPIFQVVFLLDDMGRTGTLPGLRARGVDLALENSKFDLTLALVPGSEGLGGVVEYSTDLFERDTVLRMMRHLERVLEQVAERPEARLSELTLLDGAERSLVVEEWNRTAAEYPAGRCIHQLFEAQAARTPDAVALVHETDSLTYRELNERANRLAHHLVRLGVGPEARVGVCLERGLDLVVALIAVHKAGGAYVPLDPAYPTERLRLTLADAGVAVLVTQEKLRGLVTVEPGVAVVIREQAQAEIAAESAENPESGATPRNLAYLIYTSGSTGIPKGVAIEHESAVVMIAWAWSVYSEQDFSGMLASTSISFDMSVYELFATLTRGGTVIVVENALALPASAAAEQVRLLDTVPSAAAALLKTGGIPAGVRTVNLGGEPLKAELVDDLYAHGVERVYDMYGPSEDTTFSTYALREPGGPVTIGRILSNSQAYVLDSALRPLPVGVPGELYLGGKGVTRGYLGRPGLTAGRYVPDPFSAEPGARMYRTGDRIRWKADGTLEYLGRFDHQVKVRGFRVEVGEIEAVLRRDPGVADCVVMARADDAGETRLVAYVVGHADADELRAHVKRSVPDYMVPSAFVFMDALPLTPNGKLDRQALPAPEFGSAAEAYVAPRTPTEEVLAGIWAEVLRVDRVSAEESFFSLGGHSLLATRVTSRVREVFGVEMPLRALFQAPVLSALAAEVERLRGAGAGTDAGPMVPAPRDGDLPVTFAQERLWFVDALDPGSPAYAIPFSYRLTGALDTDALGRALTELVRRHEPLRTTLPTVDGVPVQRIAPPPVAIDLPLADLRHLPDDARAAEADRLVAAAAAHRFDLARGPLFRGELVRVGEAEHLLLLNIHHAIGDGWSLGVLLQELSALYGAFAAGQPSPLPAAALQYADYAVWQRGHLSGDVLQKQVDFWRRTLDGAPALLELPADRPRPPVESHRGAVEGLTVPADLTTEVQALARREGATLFMVLLAALDVVLGRLAGQDDVVVGTPIAGRTRAETDRMVGLFLNSLALRTDISGDPTFRELLGRVRETTLAAYAHQDVPFERLLEELRPERSLAHAPVFQVMLNLLNFEAGALRAGGLQVAELGMGEEVASKFDLTLYVGERDGAIDIHLVYATDLFDAPRMREMLSQLQGVLRQAAEAPETHVRALSLATDAARAVLPDPQAPLDQSWRGAVHEVFAARAKATPGALAVEDPRERWTYAELDASTDAIARRLAAAGVGSGDVVAITGHRSAALVRALLGTMKSGAAFLVLDPSYPAARLAEYVRIARPAAHLHLPAAGELPREVADLLVEQVRTHVVIRPRGEAEAVDGEGPPPVEVGPDTLAYLSFTSGTTGMPKAVMGRHSALTHFTPWLASEFGLTPADRFSLLSGLAHDPLHRDVFTPLQLGAAVVAPEPDETGTPGYLARWMRQAGITVAHLTPAMGQLLADADEGERIPSLRRAFFVGDVLRRADVQRLTALAPNLNVVNYYGSTETQRAVSYHEVDPSSEQKEIIPLGRGIPGVQLLVRNAAGALAGIGEVGEIWMRSPHLAAGYLGDPALSATRFFVNPWTGETRDRLYRTGDLGRYRPDGEVEPLGRADQQVKVRGFRVELGEVESALAAHAAVKEAAVLAREAPGGDRRLVAYWVPADDRAHAAAAELRTHLKALLPEYMVPSAYVRLERLPLTANGKLDRRALPEPEADAAESRPAAPRTPTEELLAQAWAEVLRVDTVGVDDDFFALGGHSLLATRLLARVQNALGVALPLRALFEGPTVAALAQRVDEIRRAGVPALPPVAPVDRDGPLPLSSAQERLWFLDRLEGGSAFYNLPLALRLTGALDAAALERALGEIVRRHESLRTVFLEVDGAAAQVIAPFAGFILPVDDLSGLDGAAREAEVRRRATENAARPFDLAAGPLFRAALLRLGEDEHVLLLCIHHIVSDGWSTGVLLREMSALYKSYNNGQESPLAPLPVQYADYAVWQRDQLRGEALERQLSYWKSRLGGAPALLELPTDRPRPPVQSHRGARETFQLPGALLDRLQTLGRGEGATLYMVMLAAFQALLSKYAGSDDVVVGSPIAGRTRREVEELIGFFANTLVMRTDLGGDPAFRHLLARVRETTLGAYEHQEVPFERLVAELQPERSMSHAPLFQVLFTLQNADRSGFELPGVRLEGVAADVETTRFDLSLTVIPDPDGIHGVLEYSTDLFDRDTVLRMVGHLERVLEQVVSRPEARLSELDLLSAQERATVVEAWNRTEQEYDSERRIPHLIQAQAARTPDAVAVVFADDSLTYGELDARANRLANHLAGLGVAAEARVGICLERGLEMVVAMLAVLKAGAAYLPLDPRYPADRLAYMLEDSGARVLVTESALRELLPAEGVRIVSVDADQAAIAAESAEAPRPALQAENTAYVIYTSGSTGKPKGVQVTHGNAASFFAAMDGRVGGTIPGTWLALTRISFDIHVLELLWTLARGFKVVVHPDVEQAREELTIDRQIRRHGVTHLQCTPSLAAMLIAESGIEALAGLERLLLGGEALPADLAARITAVLPGGLVNMYGPTETTVWSTTHAVDGAVFIGRPIANTRVYVLDAGLHAMPAGVPGELYIGGAGVTRGYLNRPGLTAERFVPDPFATDPGARMYRTGDRARWRGDGTLEYLDRLDAQVKVRGFRIEPGEIEAVLRRHPDVSECAVVARGAANEKRLVAYIVGSAQAEALREHLRGSLPDYMVPAAFVTLDALPLTPNGKLDRRALPAPEFRSADVYVAPQTPVEEVLADIWGEVLGSERVGVEETFFQLGGHSLLVMRAVSRIREIFGVELPLRTFFDGGTIAQIGTLLTTDPRYAQSTAGVLALLMEMDEEDEMSSE